MAVIAALPRLGRVQRQIRRLLLIHGAMATPTLADRIYAHPTKKWHRYNVRRSAIKFAVEERRRNDLVAAKTTASA